MNMSICFIFQRDGRNQHSGGSVVVSKQDSVQLALEKSFALEENNFPPLPGATVSSN